MEAVVAVVGTLFGAVIGGLGSFLVQRTADRTRERTRLAELRRDTYVGFLAAAHALFVELRGICRTPSDDQRSRLRAVSTDDAQLSFEQVRLVGGEAVVTHAAEIWRWLRRHRVPEGDDTTPEAVHAWQESYWNMRWDFMQAARKEAGLPPLDRARAGTGTR